MHLIIFFISIIKIFILKYIQIRFQLKKKNNPIYGKFISIQLFSEPRVTFSNFQAKNSQHLYNYLIKLHSAYPTLLCRKKPSRCIPPSRYADRVVAINSPLKSAGESRGNENRIHVGCQGLKPRVNKKPFKWNVYRVFAFFSFTSRLSIPLRKLHPVNPPST